MIHGLGALAGGAPDPRLGPEANAAANKHGLMNAGLATIMASGPGGMTPFQAIAAGLMQGQQAAGQHRQSAFRTRSQEQMAEMLAANGGDLDVDTMKQLFAQAISTGDVESAKAFSTILPSMINAGAGSPPIYRESRIRDPNNPDRYIGRMINQNNPLDYYDIGEVAGPSSGVTINTGDKQDSQISGYWGAEYGKIMNAGRASRGQLARLDEMESLLSQPGVYQGTGGGAVLALRRLGESLGVDVGEGVAAAEAAQAIGRQQALELRNPEGGAGMPGALSDKDRLFLESMVAGIEKTPAGNRLIIEAARRVAKRNREVADAVIEYRRANGELDDGFFDFLDQKFGQVDIMMDLRQQLDSLKASGAVVPDGEVGVLIPPDLGSRGPGQ